VCVCVCVIVQCSGVRSAAFVVAVGPDGQQTDTI